MPGAVEELPVWAAYAFLVVVACLRGGATYGLGRLARRSGTHSARLQPLFERPGFVRTQRLVARWGAPAVTVSFLTVGVQSAVNAAAGLLRMPLTRYLPALFVGALLWAGVYVTVGVAVLTAWLEGGRLGWLLAAVAVVAVVAGLTVWWRRRA